MSERPAKRIRRQVTEESMSDSEQESGEDWHPQGTSSHRPGKRGMATTSAITMSRPRRSAAVASNASPSVTVSRSPSNSPEDRRKSIRLTVKLPSSKLREVMSEREVARLKDSLTPGVDKVLVPTDRLRNRNSTTKKYAEFGESDEEDEDEDEEEEEEEEEEGEDEDDQEDEEGEEDEPINDFDEIGAEPEETDEDDEDGENDEDVEMEGQTLPPPKIKLKTTPHTHGRASKPILVVTPATGGPARSVEQKEMELDPGDEEEELSELADDDDQDETNMNDEDDEELDDEEEGGDGEEDGLEEDELGDSDDELASGSATPDLSKLTSRQRGSAEGGFMALPMEPQIKKHFTADEQRMRRAEMARRRKNLSEKRNAEEKMSTINKLLKKQTSKRRGATAKPETIAAALAAGEAADTGSPEEEVTEKANPLFTRWISDKNGIRLGVPEEWLGKGVGKYFGPPLSISPNANGRLVQEVE